MDSFKFEKPLLEGVIVSRPNRFIMLVESRGRVVKCHCPSTGRIGGVVFKNIPCLFSKSHGKGRKTKGTVEAISLDRPSKKSKSWIGINQSKANDYIRFFLETGQLPKIASSGFVEREKKVGNSRIDLVAGKTLIEVKTPLISLPSTGNAQLQPPSRFNSFDRLVKHYGELSRKKKGSRAVLLLCYLYDAPPFKPPPPDSSNNLIQQAARQAALKGVENWQANLEIGKEGVSLLGYFKLRLF